MPISRPLRVDQLGDETSLLTSLSSANQQAANRSRDRCHRSEARISTNPSANATGAVTTEARRHWPTGTLGRIALNSRMKSFPIASVLGVISAIGLGISIYMSWIGLTGSSVVGCDGGLFNCDHVLTSRWSKFLGIPVGLPAAGLYAGLLGLLATIGFKQVGDASTAWRLVSLLSWTAGFAAVWFLSLQVFVLGHLCIYCVIAHTCSLAVWGIVQFSRPWEASVQTKNALVGATMVGILIAGQAFGTPPQTFRIEEHVPNGLDISPIESGDEADVFGAPGDDSDVFDADVFDAPVMDAPVFDAPVFDAPQSSSTAPVSFSVAMTMARWFNPSMGVVSVMNDTATTSDAEAKSGETQSGETQRRLVPVSGGRRQLDVEQWPLWGKRDAKYVIAKMFDYTCSHCRETHHAIEAAGEQLGGDLAVIVLPTPLHKSCNSASQTTDPSLAGRCTIAKLGVAMWLADPEQFTEFHNWMFQQERTVDETRNHMISLIGMDRFNEVYNGKTPSAYVDKNIFLYKEAGAGTLPKLIFPTTTVVGEISSGTTIANLIREKL